MNTNIFTRNVLVCLASIFLFSFQLKADCTYSSLTLNQVSQNQNGSYDISMTFCASGGYDPYIDITGAFGFMLEGGASILNFPSNLTSPQTNASYFGFLYNNNADTLIYFDYGQNLWWTCVSSEAECGPLQPVCQTITITTDILPNKITCGGMEGVGVLVAPYSCTGPNLEVYPNPNFPPPTPCATFSLVADAGLDQDVLYSYNNSECTTLAVNSIGDSTAPLSYDWSSGHTTSTINVCPATTTTYAVTITDGEGCTTTDEVVVNVIDIFCGNNKVLMCKPNGTTTRCVRVNRVNDKLNNGWSLGPCTANNLISMDEIEVFILHQSLMADNLNIEVRGYDDENITVHVYNLSGQMVKSLNVNIKRENDFLNLNIDELETGIYVVSLFDDDGLISSEKIVKR